jgi:hypothetical protein
MTLRCGLSDEKIRLTVGTVVTIFDTKIGQKSASDF